MTFEGCKGAGCKCAAVGMIGLCAYAVGQHEEYCEHQHRPTYCSLSWHLPHGPETDHGSINTVRVPGLTFVSSTSSSTGSAIKAA
jgi:hypothetical protein